MRAGTRDNLLLVAKTLLFIAGSLLVLASLVDLIVTGITLRGVEVLAVGLLLAGLPLGFALRDALREARRRKPS